MTLQAAYSKLNSKKVERFYRYFDVPQSEYEAFLEAPSKGTYLNTRFKKMGHRYQRVASLHFGQI